MFFRDDWKIIVAWRLVTQLAGAGMADSTKSMGNQTAGLVARRLAAQLARAGMADSTKSMGNQTACLVAMRCSSRGASPRRSRELV